MVRQRHGCADLDPCTPIPCPADCLRDSIMRATCCSYHVFVILCR